MQPNDILGHELTSAFKAVLSQQLYSLGYTNIRYFRGSSACGLIVDPGCFNIQTDAEDRITRYWVG